MNYAIFVNTGNDLEEFARPQFWQFHFAAAVMARGGKALIAGAADLRGEAGGNGRHIGAC